MNLGELQQSVRFFTNTDSDSYSDSDINANLTRWAHLFTTEILDAQDDWDFQGEIATTDLVANQREYVFPTDILKIKRIELKLDGSNWVIANFIDEAEISTPIASESDITERFNNTTPFVSLLENSIFVYSGTIIDVPDGIKIWYLEEVVGKDASGNDIASFSTSTDKPNIAEAFQRGLVYGAAKDWFDRYGLIDKSREMERQIHTIIEKMRRFYSLRSEAKMLIKTASQLEDYE